MADQPTRVTAAKGIDTPSPIVEALEKKRALPRALMGGTDTMRAAKQLYMPQHIEELDEDYNARLAQTVLYGGFSKTVKTESGKLFMKPLVINDDVPGEIKNISEDIDGEGRDIQAFANDAVREGFVDGVSYILVDAPQQGPTATLADQQAAGWAPYWVLIKAGQMLGWKHQRLGSKRVVTEVRFKECVSAPAGEYGEKESDRIRVLRRGSYAVYEKEIQADGTIHWVLIESGVNTWQDILIVPIYINRTGFFEGEPPLRELAELNQEHWASSGEQRHALTFLRFAMLMVTGIDDPKKTTVVIGANQVLKLPKGCDAKYIEHTGKGIEAGEADLTHIEARMKSANMELRIEGAGSVTATAAAIDSAESNAGLKAIALGVQDALNLALAYTAQILKAPKGGTVTIYTGFADETGSADVPQLTQLYVQNAISRNTLWDELQRRHVLSEDFDPEAEQQLLDAQQEKAHEMYGLPINLGTQQPPKEDKEPQKDTNDAEQQ